MSRYKHTIPVVCLLTVLALFSLACYLVGGECPDDDDATRVEMGDGTFSMSRSSGFIDEDARPHPDEDVYVRVLSEDTVELLYERDDQVIVETYQVTGRDTKVDYY